jgi:hypothetical protein
MSGKFNFNSSDKPKFIESLIQSTLLNPCLFKCSLSLIN